jgi:hypothetical protein
MISPASVSLEDEKVRTDASKAMTAQEEQPGVDAQREPRSRETVNSIANRGSNALSMPLSISSISRRLANKYSGAYMEHVNSVLRSSSGSSWRSSLISMRSVASHWKSRMSSSHKPLSVASASAEDHIVLEPEEVAPLSPIVFDRLTDQEATVWNELVDETRLEPSVKSFPHFGLPSKWRDCCQGLARA